MEGVWAEQSLLWGTSSLQAESPHFSENPTLTRSHHRGLPSVVTAPSSPDGAFERLPANDCIWLHRELWSVAV